MSVWAVWNTSRTAQTPLEKRMSVVSVGYPESSFNVGRWRGLYSSGTNYGLGDIVHFSGAAYIAVGTSFNVYPTTVGSNWDLMCIGTGPQGIQGVVGPAGTIALSSFTTEPVTQTATVISATTNFDVLTTSTLYCTSNTAENWTLNFRASSTVALSALLTVGSAVTVSVMATNGSSAFYPSAHTIDGVAVTPKFQGATFTAGNVSAIDAYTYTIIRTASGYVLFASQTRYA